MSDIPQQQTRSKIYSYQTYPNKTIKSEHRAELQHYVNRVPNSRVVIDCHA